MTYSDAAKAAIQVQDACNLTGVVRSFGEAMTAVRAYATEHGHGTDWINRHPVAVLFADKLADMTGRIDFDAYARATEACRELADPGRGERRAADAARIAADMVRWRAERTR